MVYNVVFNCLNIDKLEVINETIHSSAEVTSLLPYLSFYTLSSNCISCTLLKFFHFHLKTYLFVVYYNS